MTDTLSSLLDATQCATQSPAWFRESTKLQCAALPTPLKVSDHGTTISLVYKKMGMIVERRVDYRNAEHSEQGTYTLYVSQDDCPIEFELPRQTEELARYLK